VFGGVCWETSERYLDLYMWQMAVKAEGQVDFNTILEDVSAFWEHISKL
jgi:hypothetical protein